MEKYTFKTKRYEVEYFKTSCLAIAMLFKLPREKNDWPFVAESDLGVKYSRQKLIRKLCTRAIERFLDEFFKGLRIPSPKKF